MRKFILALLFTLPATAFAADLEGYYITPKGGVSKSMNTGVTYGDAGGGQFDIKNNDLGSGHAFGLSVGKYITNNFRLELEVSQRGGLKYDTEYASAPNLGATTKSDIDAKSIFINGFYDFKSFTISSSLVTPYLGGGIGISRNKMGTVTETSPSPIMISTLDGNTSSEFAYKIAAGTLLSLTEKLSLDISYQYINLGKFKSGLDYVIVSGGSGSGTMSKALSSGEIKSQELMVGLNYKF